MHNSEYLVDYLCQGLKFNVEVKKKSHIASIHEFLNQYEKSMQIRLMKKIKKNYILNGSNTFDSG